MPSSSSEQKRRPPPIALPSTFSPPHRVPAAKPFASNAEGPERVQRRSQNAPQLQQRPHTRDGSETPLSAAHRPENHVQPLPRSNSVTRFRESASTTITNLVDHARGGLSPKKSLRKSDYSRTSEYSQGSTLPSANSHNSHNTSSTRSRHGERVYRPDLSVVGEEKRTLRGEMEKQKERKLFKMMGTVPDTPRDGSFVPDGLVNTNDLRTIRASKDSNPSKQTGDAAPKSPKKKFLGISMPTFLSSNSVSIAPPVDVDSKALKVLGSSPTKKRKGRASPRSPRAAKLSESSKSLPSKVLDHHSRNNRRRHEFGNLTSSSRVNVRSTDQRSQTMSSSSPSKDVANGKPFETDAVVPPTPPQKDTPERLKNWLRQNNADGGMKMMHLPTMQLLEPGASVGSGESPEKFCPKGAADHPHLRHTEHVKSAYVVVEYTETEASERQTDEENSSLPEDSSYLEGSSDPEEYLAFLESQISVNDTSSSAACDHSDLPEPQQTPRAVQRRHSDLPTRTSLSAPATAHIKADPLEILKPTVYVPPPNAARGRFDHLNKSDKVRLPLTLPLKPPPGFEEDKAGPADITTHHSANDASPSRIQRDENKSVTFAHRFMQSERQIGNQDPYVDNTTRTDPRPQSSSLTDMFDSVTPSRIATSDFRPTCLSAVPSPLHRGPGSSQPASSVAQDYPPGQKPGMTMGDHFFVTNEHIDVVACTLWDKIVTQAKQQADSSSVENKKLLDHVDEQFEEIKSSIRTINEHSAARTGGLSRQLDTVVETIKKEMIGSMEAQTKKLTDLEQMVRELHKATQDLQKSNERHLAAASYTTQQNALNNFPNHTSQPSLPGFYEIARQEPTPTPYQQQATGYNGGYRTGNGGFHSRSGHVSREGKDDENPFARTNPYHTPTGVGSSSGFNQALQQHYGYSPNHDFTPYQNFQQQPQQQHYSGSQGPAK